MSLLNQASLIQIPSGYKEGTLYSAKPINGDGDLDFTRSNDTATRVNSDGLIEKVRTNLLTYSEEFDDADWVKVSGGTGSAPIVTANAIISPDGTSNAEQIVFDVGAGTSSANMSIISQPLTLTIGLKYAGSIYLKGQLGGEQIMFRHAAGATFTLLTLTTEWVRYDVIEVAGGTSSNFQIGIRQGLVGTINSTATIFAWGAQFETGDIATDYIPTTSAAVSVGMLANVPRLDYTGGGCPKLLLEPQRTNLALYSEQFDNASWVKQTDTTISSNATTSPDGYTNADKLVNSTSVNRQAIYQNSSLTGVVSFSVFAKKAEYDVIQLTDGREPTFFANFDLTNGVLGSVVGFTASIQDYGNGWYRCAVTNNYGALTINQPRISLAQTTTEGRLVEFAGSGTDGAFIWGAQVEAGSYVSSYINTLSAASTRGQDACFKTGISSLIGQTEGVIYVEGTIVAEDLSANRRIVSISDGSSANSIQVFNRLATNKLEVDSNVGGVSQFSLQSGDVGFDTIFKCALAYKENDIAFYVNGTQIGTDNSASIPATSKLAFSRGDLLFAHEGNINQAILFPTRLTNAELAELTTL
jgi:hypothetical protein